MSLPLIRVHGTPLEQGIQHGSELREQIHHNLNVYFDRFLREVELSREDVLWRAQRYADKLYNHKSAYWETMRGIAQGAQVSTDEIVTLNIRYEVLYYEFGVNEMVDGCTSFAIDPQVSQPGHVFIGQNWDWIPNIKGALIHISEPGTPTHLAFTEAGIAGGKIGLNDAGVGLAINGLTSMGDDWQRFHSPFHARCYDILRSPDFERATRVITDEPRSCSSNFLIAQPPDKIINIEAAPDNLNYLSCEQGAVVHANHFVDPDGTGIVEPDTDFRPNSWERHRQLERLMRRDHPFDLEDIKHRLRDHDGYPNSVCRHPDLSDEDYDRYSTVTSIIMDLNAKVLYATSGPPCEQDYEAYPLG